jgi:hypothetical protein
MWAFRRDPESLSTEEKQALEALFEKIPALSSTFAHFNTLICAARSPIERPRRIDPTTLALAPGSGPSNGLRPPGPAH